jgi:hypothetical protein
MSFSAWAYTIAVALSRVRVIILEREAGAEWLNLRLSGKSK